MLALVSGHYPSGADEVAVTSGVASMFNLKVNATWRVGGVARRVVGIVENPQSLLDEFALVVPGQVANPTGVTVLFDDPGALLSSFKGVEVQSPASVAQSNPLNPETISLVALVLGMLLIALVSIGGFTVLAQRRMRAIGMLESTGATDRHVRLVVRANGTVVGVVGAILGFGLGLVVWLAYRPRLEQSAHHVIGVLALSWTVVIAAMVLAVVATFFAASRPARAITKVPIVQALSGRPVPPRQIHRSAVPGIVCLVAAFLLLGYAGGTNNGNGGGGSPRLLLGIVLLIPGLILFAPFFLSLAARLGRDAPIAIRLALRDLARYRARSGSALAAISIGVLVAVIVMLAAASRYGNVLDYAGPNLSSNQLALSARLPPPGQQIVRRNAKGQLVPLTNQPVETATPAQLAAGAAQVARSLGAQLIPLESPNAGLNGTQGGRNWNGQIYVATPQLLRAFGITASEVNPDADILSARPGLSGVSGLVFNYASNGKAASAPGAPGSSSQSCTAAAGCLAHPVIQEVGALPTGTSAPNTVITEHAMREFNIQWSTTDWLVQGSEPFTAAQISNAEHAASTMQLSVESKNDQPSSSAVIDGDDLRDCHRPRRARHVGRAGAKRDGQRPPHACRNRRVQFHSPHADGGHRGSSRIPRRTARRGGWLHRHDRLAARQFAERRDRRARERSRRGPSSSALRHAGVRCDRWLALRRPRSRRHRAPADRINGASTRAQEQVLLLSVATPSRSVSHKTP